MKKTLVLLVLVLTTAATFAQSKNKQNISGLHMQNNMSAKFHNTNFVEGGIPQSYISIMDKSDTIRVKLGDYYFKMRFTDTLFMIYNDGAYDLKTKDTTIHFPNKP